MFCLSKTRCPPPLFIYYKCLLSDLCFLTANGLRQILPASLEHNDTVMLNHAPCEQKPTGMWMSCNCATYIKTLPHYKQDKCQLVCMFCENVRRQRHAVHRYWGLKKKKRVCEREIEVCGQGRGRKCVCVSVWMRVCACIKIGDFLVRVAGLGISLGSDWERGEEGWPHKEMTGQIWAHTSISVPCTL